MAAASMHHVSKETEDLKNSTDIIETKGNRTFYQEQQDTESSPKK
jgi:hypothetical protein